MIRNSAVTRHPIFFAAAALGATAAALAAVRKLTLSPPPTGSVILITGGSRGLGLAIAKRFAKQRVRLALVARDRQELEAAQTSLRAEYVHLQPEDFCLIAADLSEPAECRRAVAETISRLGRIDVLVNNAGVIEVGPLEAQTEEAFERVMRVNFFAAMYMTWAALPHLTKQTPLPGLRRRAAVVNISSVGGKIAVPHMLPYSAAKFALTGFSQGLHSELRWKGIRVTTVCPGLMRTGGENHVNFVGDVEAERAWFDFAAKTPGIATTAEHAANRIYNAVAEGLAEIIITPQAWLGARFAGVAPETLQLFTALANRYLLPPAPGVPYHAAERNERA